MADRCEEFLAKQESWIGTILKGDDESPDILPALAQPGSIEKLNKARDEYEEVLKHCPKHLSEYRKHLARNGEKVALWGVPPLPKGAPRKDDLAQEAIKLKRRLSYSKVAKNLNEKYGPGTTTEGAVRQLIRSRKPPSAPE